LVVLGEVGVVVSGPGREPLFMPPSPLPAAATIESVEPVTGRPVWLLDVDGVLNAARPGGVVRR
jgi:hypothetical protein